ncbi:MAG: hypothetical protein ACFFA7_13235 [Promethearchaeota archaeon]
MSTTINKIFNGITNNSWIKRKPPKNLTILSNGGVILTRKGEQYHCDSTFEGAFLAAITMFTETFFQKQLIQVRLNRNSIIIKRSDHFIIYIIAENNKHPKELEMEEVLDDLLNYLEVNYRILEDCPGYINPHKVQYLLKQFANINHKIKK